MVDKISWTEPLDSERSGLEFARRPRWWAKADGRRTNDEWTRMVCCA